MSRTLISLPSLCIIITIFLGGHTRAQNVPQAAALKVIRETAADICTTVPTEGSGSSLELTGSAKAKLDGVVSKVVDLGVDAAAKYQSDQYKSVLRGDLAQAIGAANNCKLAVFNTLVAKMLPSEARPGTGDDSAQPTSVKSFTSTLRPNGAIFDMEIHTSYSGDHGQFVQLQVCAKQNGATMCTSSHDLVSIGNDDVSRLAMPIQSGGFFGVPLNPRAPIDYQVCFVVPGGPGTANTPFGCKVFTR